MLQWTGSSNAKFQVAEDAHHTAEENAIMKMIRIMIMTRIMIHATVMAAMKMIVLTVHADVMKVMTTVMAAMENAIGEINMEAEQ